MIKSKEDYLFYLEADRIALGESKKRPRIIGDEIWVFERLLRKAEYYNNCKKSIFYRPYYLFILLRLYILGILLGFTIPQNSFGPGLSIAHRGTIIVSNYAQIGANCRLHACVNIGVGADTVDKAPKIGNNVYIGPGAKLFGDIEIADEIAIGANSVVNKSFHEPRIRIAGVPAKEINKKSSNELLIKATELLQLSEE